MADNQLTLFDPDTLPGMACHKPTRKNPNGRTGTSAGYTAHRTAGETVCEECLEGSRLQQLEYKRNYYLTRRETAIEASRRRYAEKKDEILKKQKEYYELTKHDQKESRNNYRINNRDKYSEWNRTYRQRNPEKGREQLLRKRARLRELPSDGYTLDDVTKTHGTVCYLCETDVDTSLAKGTSLSPEIDHVHPISAPDCPGDILSNVRWTHSFCNRSKGARRVSDLNLPFPAPQLSIESGRSAPDQ